MQILNKGQVNELVLNINNNTRQSFSAYTLTFTHVLSQEEKSYTIDKSNPAVYGQNDRYCEIQLDLTGANDLNYEGQYLLQIYGNGSNLVMTSMARLNGNTEDNSFISYVSPNEDGEQFIYIDEV